MLRQLREETSLRKVDMKKGILNFLHGVFLFLVIFGASAFWYQVFCWLVTGN